MLVLFEDRILMEAIRNQNAPPIVSKEESGDLDPSFHRDVDNIKKPKYIGILTIEEKSRDITICSPFPNQNIFIFSILTKSLSSTAIQDHNSFLSRRGRNEKILGSQLSLGWNEGKDIQNEGKGVQTRVRVYKTSERKIPLYSLFLRGKWEN
jgi:hypothetical protein